MDEEIAKTPLILMSGKQRLEIQTNNINPSSKFVGSRHVPVTSSSVAVARTSKKKNGEKGSRFSPSNLEKTVAWSSSKSSMPLFRRRNSTGGMLEKQSPKSVKFQSSGNIFMARKSLGSASGPGCKTLTKVGKSSLSSSVSKIATSCGSWEQQKISPIPFNNKNLCIARRDGRKQGTAKDSARNPLISACASKKVSSSLDCSRSNCHRAGASQDFSSSICSPVFGDSKRCSSSYSLGRSSLSSRQKKSTADKLDTRLNVLMHVHTKAGDDDRLDLRGGSINSLKACESNLSQNLEFIYLRDNHLSSLEGIEILKRVKVLDLSFNAFKGHGFELLENCKALQQLYLAGNQITSLASMPELPNLEFLSVAQNKLKSLSMASQPRLQVLAASKNKISTLQGFPHLPMLEHLRVEENPILNMQYLEAASILLVGPTLKKLNDRDLSLDMQEIAKLYPPHASVCIRDGWAICDPEIAADSSLSFLVEQWKYKLPRGYSLKRVSIDQPFEGDACHCHFIFSSERSDLRMVLRFQWFKGGITPTKFVPIADEIGEVYWPKFADIGEYLKVECTPIIEGIEYPSIFAFAPPVSPGTGNPRVVSVNVHGNPVEGSVIKGCTEVAWCGGTPAKGVISWLRQRQNNGPAVALGAEDEEYFITKADIGTRLIFIYIPVTVDGAKGEAKCAMTDIVKAAPPSVSNVHIIGDSVEGNIIKGIGAYFGGLEGFSKFQWLRENEEAREFLLRSCSSLEYTLTKEDVGNRLTFLYTPVNSDGEEGEPASCLSDVVRQAPPRASDLKITGDLREGNILVVGATVIGCSDGFSTVQWFRTRFSEVDGENGLEALSAARLDKEVHLPLGAVGYYVVAKFTPMFPNGDIGCPLYVISGEIVERYPKVLSLRILGNVVEGSTLHADKKYWGGEEGDSLFHWIRTSVGGRSEIIGETFASYTTKRDDIGCMISVSLEPLRCDGARGPAFLSEKVGPILPGFPTCDMLEFYGSLVEGQKLCFISVYNGGEKGNCEHEWYRLKSSASKDQISSHEFLDLNIDVDCRIELVYTPVRIDGERGNRWSIISDVIVPANPTGIQLLLPDCCDEDKEVVPQRAYYGGYEGNVTFIWYRTQQKLHDLDLETVLDASDHIVVGRNLTYWPCLEDVGAYLSLCWVPVRAGGKCGEPLFTVCKNPVAPAFPVVSNVHIKELSSGIYCGEGKYYGGHEGSSSFSWYREAMDGTISLIHGASALTYKVADADYNCRLLFGYKPARSDMVAGEIVLSDPTDVLFPELPKIQILSLTGNTAEGETLMAHAVIPDSDSQQHVWNTYKKDVTYRWFCSPDPLMQSFDLLPSQYSCSYMVQREDIGRYLKCECVVTDVFGRSSDPESVITASIVPGNPTIYNLEVEGRGFHTNLYAVRGVYKGGTEGKSKIQWLRAMVGSPDLISVPGETRRMYEANVDDVGYRLIAVYTPIREDGAKGRPVSASTETITVEPDVHKEVKKKLELGSMKFEAFREMDLSIKRSSARSVERRILEVNSRRIKVVKPGSKMSFPSTEIYGNYAPPFHVEIFRDDQHRLKIVIDNEKEVELMVQTRHMRDVVVLVIRGFAQKFNSTSLNALLKTGI